MTASRMAGAFSARTMLLGIIGIGSVALLWSATLPGADAGVQGRDKAMLHRDIVEQRFALPASGTLELQGLNGSVAITAWDRPEVAIRLEKTLETLAGTRTWPWQKAEAPFATDEEAQAYFSDLDFAVDHSGQGLLVTGAKPDRRSGVVFTARYEIHIPAHTAVSVRDAGGTIECDGLQGAIDALTARGDIRLRGVAGPVKAETSAGDIRIAYADQAGPASDVLCRTLDGSIHVALPASSEFNLDVDALSGRFLSDFPVTVEPPLGRNRIRAQVGAGGPLVSFSTLDGDITLAAL
jgi:hypothetical protein